MLCACLDTIGDTDIIQDTYLVKYLKSYLIPDQHMLKLPMVMLIEYWKLLISTKQD